MEKVSTVRLCFILLLVNLFVRALVRMYAEILVLTVATILLFVVSMKEGKHGVYISGFIFGLVLGLDAMSLGLTVENFLAILSLLSLTSIGLSLWSSDKKKVTKAAEKKIMAVFDSALCILFGSAVFFSVVCFQRMLEP